MINLCGRALLFSFVLALCSAAIAPAATTDPRPPNIILIFADDLGPGDLGCYGSTKIKTPNIDALARRGVRFDSAYSGSPVCASSRACLLTGLHSGHSPIRDNKEVKPEGQEPIPEGVAFMPEVLKSAGYATAIIGKWGLGPPGSVGDPNRRGFDLFFGYNCQRHAHNFYPTFLYRNADRVELPANAPLVKRGDEPRPVYAPDLCIEEAESFIRENRAQPFFLFFATTVPHLALQVPEDSLAEYKDAFPEVPYDGKRGYLPHATPRAAYAAMVSRMDRDVGRLTKLVQDLQLDQDTLLIFASDNGPTLNVGGADSPFFDSAQGRRGLKQELYEGGIRVPLIISWPGKAREGLVDTTPCGLWDLFPTSIVASGKEPPANLDGISLLPAVTGDGLAPQRELLYWETPIGGYVQAVRIGHFKGIRGGLKKDPTKEFELYDLATDPNETTNIAGQNPEMLRRMHAAAATRTRATLPEWNWD